MIGDHCIKAWSVNQTVIALSSGEAEFYALTRATALAMGARSLLEDLGVKLKIRVLTDATTGKAIASRRGLGKVRHIATHELWIQEKVMRGDIELIKIKNVFNTADLFTKHLDRATMDSCVTGMGHNFEGGRSADAPELNMCMSIPHNSEMSRIMLEADDDNIITSAETMLCLINDAILGYDQGQNQCFKNNVRFCDNCCYN